MAVRLSAARWALGAALGLAIGGCGPSASVPSPGAATHESSAKPQEIGSLSISQAVVRPGQVGGNTAAFLLLTSRNASEDRLIGVSSAIAGRVEIHEHVHKPGGRMAMQPVNRPLVLPAQGQLAFAPGGLHVMAFGLQRPLIAGEAVPLTLVFEKAGPVEIELSVGIPPRPKRTQAHAQAQAHGSH